MKRKRAPKSKIRLPAQLKKPVEVVPEPYYVGYARVSTMEQRLDLCLLCSLELGNERRINNLEHRSDALVGAARLIKERRT